ncbi:MAG: hypothetical protein JWM89_1487 [Acidimicrobiales bacterium]|nr:hypothetical protein [Acidimicrobiales bacterium]
MVATRSGSDPQRASGGVALVVGLAAAVAAPVVVAGIRAASSGWNPTVDDATIATRSWDVWTSRSPMVGQVSMAGQRGTVPAHSPGPLLYWLLSVPARVGPTWTLTVFMAVFNALLLVGVVLLAHRRAGTGFAVATALGIVLLVRSVGIVVLTDIWNPWASLAPFLLLLFLCWSIADGDRRLLPVAVLVASFVMQTHLTYVIPSVLLLLVAVGGGWGTEVLAWVRSRRRGERGSGARVLLLATVVGIGCWVVPVIEEVTHDPGNLTLVRQAGTSAEGRGGLDAVRGAVGQAFGVPPRFVRPAADPLVDILDGIRPGSGAATVGLLAVVVALAAVLVSAVRRRDRIVVTGAAAVVAALIGAVAVAASLPLDRGLVAGYSFEWFRIAGLLAWLIIGLGLARSIATSSMFATRPALWWSERFGASASARPARPAPLVPLVVSVVMSVVVLGVGLALPRHDPTAWSYRPARQLGDALVRATEPGKRYLVGETGAYDVAFSPVIVWRLRTSGRIVIPVTKRVPAYGDGYRASGHRCAGVVVLQAPGTALPPGARRVADVRLADAPGLPDGVRLALAPDTSAHGAC